MKFFIPILPALLLVACASSGTGIKTGESRLEDVLLGMGNPAMQWQDPDGSRQLSYPRGIYSFMVYIGADGKMQFSKNDPLIPRTYHNLSILINILERITS